MGVIVDVEPGMESDPRLQVLRSMQLNRLEARRVASVGTLRSSSETRRQWERLLDQLGRGCGEVLRGEGV